MPDTIFDALAVAHWLREAYERTGGRLGPASVFLVKSGNPSAHKALLYLLKCWAAIDNEATHFTVDANGLVEIVVRTPL